MSILKVKLFGTLCMEYDGQLVTRFQSKKVKDLLSYLLLNRETMHSREGLAGRFWGDLDDHKARHCLCTTLWRLQHVLGNPDLRELSYLRVDSQNIGFNRASDFWLDVAEFESRCAWADQVAPHSREQQAEFYGQAVALYQADLLVDCYEDWCLIERERLQCLYMRALSRLLTYHSARHEYDVAIDYARRILACDPLREEVHRDLVRLYLAAHQRTAALHQYRACEDILRQELGVDPMPETQALLAEMFGANRPMILVGSRPAGGYHPGSPFASDVGQNLVTALAHLHKALDIYDGFRAQLQEATALLDEVAYRLESAFAADTGQSSPGQEMATPRLLRAAMLVAEVVHDLERGWELRTGQSPTSTAR